MSYDRALTPDDRQNARQPPMKDRSDTRAGNDHIAIGMARSRRCGLRTLLATLLVLVANLPWPAPAAAPAVVATSAVPEGQQLYEQHCANCHGTTGDGQGPGARSVYPPPRNLAKDHYRLISHRRSAPVRTDLLRILEFGIPGTAMTDFRNLPLSDRRLIVDWVMHLRSIGLSDRTASFWREIGEPFDDRDLSDSVAEQMDAGPPLAVPEGPPVNPEMIARGKQVFARHACAQCHGDDGRGARDLALFDENDVLIRPRDLVAEPKKGGDTRQALVLRIRLGMPGSPMPAHPALTDPEMIDLIAYVQSLVRLPLIQSTNHQRRQWVVGNRYLDRSR